MKYLFLPLLFILNIGVSQPYKTVQFSDVQEILKSSSETLYVLNFWANWSKDSEKDLPFLDKLEEKYQGKKLKVILICIDEKQDLEKWVEPFLKDLNLKSEVWWLDVNDINLIKHKVDKHWTQELPFTLMRRGSTGQRYWKDGGSWSEKALNKKLVELL